MQNSIAFLLYLLASATPTVLAVGTAYGFATGVSGGGSATAQVPSDINQLKTWLSDSTTRVILLDKTYNFKGTEGTKSGAAACYQSTCTLAQGGQDYLDNSAGSCTGSNMVKTTTSYDIAGTTALKVGSNKTLLGKGSAGVLQGKGLQLIKGASNVIIQNIHITDINPKTVWGGDALDFQGDNTAWIDHVKFSKVGRQFVVSHYGRLQATFSNNDFDGTTTTSATCNGQHYWTNMFIGASSAITLDRNYFRNLSGRAPKLGEPGMSQDIQATNNYFYNMKGHAFDVYTGTTLLAEGNVFESVTTPFTSSSSAGSMFVTDSGSTGTCSSYLGRSCQANNASGGGGLISKKDTGPLSKFQSYGTRWTVAPIAVGSTKSTVTANSGVGKVN